MIECRVCKNMKPETDYFKTSKQPKTTGNVFYDKVCKACKHEKQTARRRAFKQRMIDHMGGKCQRCGFDDPCVAAYDIHHRDPQMKELLGRGTNTNSINGSDLRTWSRVVEELKSCNLLCRNCHSIVHYIDDLEWLDSPVPRKTPKENADH